MEPETMSWSELKTAKSDNAWSFFYITRGSVYDVYAGDRFGKFVSFVRASADVTDFEDNHKAAATSVGNVGVAFSKIDSGVFKVFTAEALAADTFEDSLVVGCDAAHKTFNIENTHVSAGLNYKIFGSPDNSEWEEIKSSTLLAASTKTSVVNNDMWKFIKIAAEGSGAASTVTAYIQVGT